jgi:hypothetical protein
VTCSAYPHLFTVGDLAFFDLGGSCLFLSRVEGDTDLHDSIIYFRVDDMHPVYEQLRARHVVFPSAPR